MANRSMHGSIRGRHKKPLVQSGEPELEVPNGLRRLSWYEHWGGGPATVEELSLKPSTKNIEFWQGEIDPQKEYVFFQTVRNPQDKDAHELRHGSLWTSDYKGEILYHHVPFNSVLMNMYLDAISAAAEDIDHARYSLVDISASFHGGDHELMLAFPVVHVVEGREAAERYQTLIERLGLEPETQQYIDDHIPNTNERPSWNWPIAGDPEWKDSEMAAGWEEAYRTMVSFYRQRGLSPLQLVGEPVVKTGRELLEEGQPFDLARLMVKRGSSYS